MKGDLKMKKLAILLTIALLLGTFAGCHSSIDMPSDSVSIPSENSEPTRSEDIPAEPYVFPLEDDVEESIIEGFCGLMAETYDAIGSKLSVRCYWQDEDDYVVYIDGYREYEDVPTSFIAASKEFLFPTTQPLYIYSHGTFYRFSVDSVRVLNLDEFYTYHIAQYAGLYDSQTEYEKTAINCPALLNEEKRTQLESAFGIDHYLCTDSLWYTNDRPDAAYWYLDSHDGYDIVLCVNDALQQTNIQVGDCSFAHVKPFDLYGFKDGTLTALKDIYDEGKLSDNALEAVYVQYIQCIKAYMERTNKFEPVDVRILRQFCALTGKDYDDVYKQLSTRTYWESEESMVVYIEGSDSQENVVTTINYGDIVFMFPTEQPMYLYIKGQDKVYPLNWWSCDFFPGEDLSKFYEYNKEQNAELYAPEYIYERPVLHCPALLTAEDRMQIEESLENEGYFCNDSLWYTEGCPVSFYRYYGTDNGYDIIFFSSGSGMTVAQSMEIDGVYFNHSMPFNLFAYKDGALLNLEDAYAEGLISREALEQAGQYQAACEEYHAAWMEIINNQLAIYLLNT